MATASNANLTLSGPLSGSSVTVQGTTGNNTINVGGAITASGTVTLSAHGSGPIKQAGGSITAGTLVLSSGSGDIATHATPLLISTANLQTSTTGAAYMVDSQSVSVGAFSGSGFELKTTGSITVAGNLSVNGPILTVTPGSNGSIILGANVELRVVRQRSLLTEAEAFFAQPAQSLD